MQTYVAPAEGAAALAEMLHAPGPIVVAIGISARQRLTLIVEVAAGESTAAR